MAVRLQHSGHSKFMFFLTPDEFEKVMEVFVAHNSRYQRSDFEGTLLSLPEVLEKYRQYYQIHTQPEEPQERKYVSLCYNIRFQTENENMSIFQLDDGQHFYIRGRLVREKLPALRWTFPKGLMFDCEDEKGGYMYDDIREILPESYALWQELTTMIKKMTKPLKFRAERYDTLEEVRTPIRISQQVAADLEGYWLFRKHGIQMLSYKPKGVGK